MRATIGRLGIAMAVAALVAGCGADENPELMNLRKDRQGPDEFSILPTRPLQMPTNLSALPTPTPGGTNLTDPMPMADAIAALGGRSQALRDQIPFSDNPLITQVSRYGADPAIRTTLAGEDLKWRQKNNGRFLERMFNLSVYADAYKPMSLNQYTESERWRALGVQTPAAPPIVER